MELEEAQAQLAVASRGLAEAEQRIRAIFWDSPIGIGLSTLDGRVVEVNMALGEMLGYGPDELAALDGHRFAHDEDREKDADLVRRLVAGQIPRYRVDVRFRHALGYEVWGQMDGSLIRDADGRPQFVVHQIQDISERRHYEERLQHLAHHDTLTGLLNRRGFDIALKRQVDLAQRYGSGGALLMFDLDNFKTINDTYGHQAGDELIGAVADALRRRLRGTDVVARLGGDEFAALLPRGDLSGAVTAAQSVLRVLEELPPIPHGAQHRVGVSIGIAALSAAATAPDLLVCADLAMYDAKASGRNRAVVYAPERHGEPQVSRAA